MPDLDLEPGAYRVKNRREPILLRGWWMGILLFLAIVLFGAFVMKPLFGIVQPQVTSFIRSLLSN